MTDHLPALLEPLLSGDCRFSERSRVENTAVVLVQVFRDDVHILLVEPFDELANEFHLKGIDGL